MKSELTQHELKKNLHYCPNSGTFTWILGRPGVMAGKIAGTYDKTTGYIRIRINKKGYWLHRLVFLYIDGKFPDNEVDHINHNKTDNRIINLRKVTKSQNQRNRPMNKNNSSGVTGVYFHDNCWKARIRQYDKHVNLGCFDSKEEAIAARKNAEHKYNFHKNHGMDFLHD